MLMLSVAWVQNVSKSFFLTVTVQCQKHFQFYNITSTWWMLERLTVCILSLFFALFRINVCVCMYVGKRWKTFSKTNQVSSTLDGFNLTTISFLRCSFLFKTKLPENWYLDCEWYDQCLNIFLSLVRLPDHDKYVSISTSAYTF